MCPGVEITPASQLYRDLGLHGEDAAELLGFLSKQYNVNFSEFQFNDFFTDEVFSYRDFMRLLKTFSMAPRKTVSMDDLVRIAKSGYWDI